jgi:hypothetical protein
VILKLPEEIQVCKLTTEGTAEVFSQASPKNFTWQSSDDGGITNLGTMRSVLSRIGSWSKTNGKSLKPLGGWVNQSWLS